MEQELAAEAAQRLASGQRLNPVQQRVADGMELTPEMLHLLELQRGDQSAWPLSRVDKKIARAVRAAAQEVHGDDWNYYSNAMAPAAAHVFGASVEHLAAAFEAIDFLEIGSCLGLSMSLIAGLIRHHSQPGSLVSVDPYFAEGYVEGAHGIWEIDRRVDIDKAARDRAYELYRRLGLTVEHIEEVSQVGLCELIRAGRRFHLIYIDGAHEGLAPLRDLGLALELIVAGGVIMLDDHHWPDVAAVKRLCDLHCRRVAESWKVAAYEMRP